MRKGAIALLFWLLAAPLTNACAAPEAALPHIPEFCGEAVGGDAPGRELEAVEIADGARSGAWHAAPADPARTGRPVRPHP